MLTEGKRRLCLWFSAFKKVTPTRCRVRGGALLDWIEDVTVVNNLNKALLTKFRSIKSCVESPDGSSVVYQEIGLGYFCSAKTLFLSLAKFLWVDGNEVLRSSGACYCPPGARERKGLHLMERVSNLGTALEAF